METTASPHISIRLATEADRIPLIQLAALDSAVAPHEPVLVADLGGDIVAAHSLARSASIADPFRLTADARELLELRASQIRPLPTTSQPRRRHLPFLIRRRGVGSAGTLAA
jgi:hypothetical protein